MASTEVIIFLRPAYFFPFENVRYSMPTIKCSPMLFLLYSVQFVLQIYSLSRQQNGIGVQKSSWPTPFLPLGWIERIAVGRKFSAEPPGGSVSYRKLSFPTLWLLSHNIFPLFHELFNMGDIEMSTKGITHKARYQGTRCRRCQVSWGWYICPICNLQYWAPMKWTKVQF